MTEKSIRLVNSDTLELVNKWEPPQGKINAASCNFHQILIVTGGNTLTYLEIQSNSIQQRSSTKLEYEISCININPFGSEEKAKVCSIGLWTDISVRLLQLPSLSLLTKDILGGETIPRSVLMTSFENIDYLLCALADGHLFSYIIEQSQGNYQLKNKKKISLGTQQIMLSTFKSNDTNHVFAASDRPTVIYSSNQKLLFANVNLKEANYMCPFNSESLPDSLAIATEEGLTIGTIDDIQKLHIKTVPLGEMPKSIAHQPSSNTYVVTTIKTHIEQGEEVQTAYIRLIDDQTFEIIDSFQFKRNEESRAVITCTFTDDNNYFVVGSTFLNPDEEKDPSSGRILIFNVVDNKLKLVSEINVDGAVYTLCPFNGKLLAGINSKVSFGSKIILKVRFIFII